jgi:hypothetical protein
MVLSDATVFQVGRHLGFVIVGKDTLLIEREDSWDVKLSVDNTISEDLLHHFLLR